MKTIDLNEREQDVLAEVFEDFLTKHLVTGVELHAEKRIIVEEAIALRDRIWPKRMSIDDAIYGLRNVFIGDDEQTRIEDYVELIPDAATRDVVELRLAAGNYDAAYEIAIRYVLAPLTREQLVTAIETWCKLWLAEMRDDDPECMQEEVTAEDLLKLYDFTDGWENRNF